MLDTREAVVGWHEEAKTAGSRDTSLRHRRGAGRGVRSRCRDQWVKPDSGQGTHACGGSRKIMGERCGAPAAVGSVEIGGATRQVMRRDASRENP